jgi:hypothetical protein
MPTDFPPNITDAIAGYEMVLVLSYPWNDYSSEGAMYYMDGIMAMMDASDYDIPCMWQKYDPAGFNFYSGQPGTYTLKVLAMHFPDFSSKMDYLGSLEVVITNYL